MSKPRRPSTRGDYSAHTRRCLLPAAVEVYGDRVTTRAIGGPPDVAETLAGVLVTGVECRALARSKQAECCSWRAHGHIDRAQQTLAISSRPEKQNDKICPSMCARICSAHGSQTAAATLMSSTPAWHIAGCSGYVNAPLVQRALPAAPVKVALRALPDTGALLRGITAYSFSWSAPRTAFVVV